MIKKILDAVYNLLNNIGTFLANLGGGRNEAAGMLGADALMPPKNNPDMLLIGCIDARLDPRNDIGIPDGKAAIYRNIGAVIAPNDSSVQSNDQAEALTDAIKKGVRHIAVMGHTCCGGMNACLCGTDTAFPAVHDHLKPFQGVRSDVIAKGGELQEQERAMEQGSVRQSIENLMTYPVVAEAVKSGKVQLHGWVINTATKRIKEMDPKTKAFKLMEVLPSLPQPGYDGKFDVVDLVRFQQRSASSADLTPPEQFPDTLLMSDMDASSNPTNIFKIPYGKVLIHRELDPCAECNRTSQEAALQFAISAKKVKDVVLMLHSNSDLHSDAAPGEQRQTEEDTLRRRMERLKSYPVVAQALADGSVKLHGWILDSSTRNISEMDLETGQFKPMGEQEQAAHWAEKIQHPPMQSLHLKPATL